MLFIIGLASHVCCKDLLTPLPRTLLCGCLAGGKYVWFCGIIQYLNLVGTGIGYTVTAGLSMT